MIPEQETLADRAYARVEEMIVTLELAPGELVSESELTTKLDIGRTPLREAVQRLAKDQLVEILPRKGILVSEIHLLDHLDVLEARRPLDRLVVRRAADRATPEQRDTLRTCARSMREAADVDALAEFMRIDRRFDDVVAHAAQNAYATRALAPLHIHCRRFWFKYEANGDLSRAANLHERLIEAIAASEPDSAAETSDALIDYLEHFTRSILGPAEARSN